MYDLGLTTEQFYELTPRKFSLLMEAHRRRLAHQEMVGAYTTAAIINFAFCPPKEPVKPSDFMPNYVQDAPQPVAQKRTFTEEQVAEWQARIASLAAEMKAGQGPLLDEIKRKSDAE